MFCSVCGALMSPTKGKYVCNSCGNEVKKDASSGTTGQIISRGVAKETIMITEEKSGEPLDSDAVCPKCKHSGAYYLLKQTRSADEPETKFYTCESCGYRWREY
ncbi:DNA-directed RNA polymerase subunit M [uncultured archaeon]|nr:DNA-directed RNA polymerase subunit M [uncultured archaeon]